MEKCVVFLASVAAGIGIVRYLTRHASSSLWLVGFLAGIVIRQWGELPGLLVAIACMMVVPVLLAAFGTMAWSGKEMFLKKGDKK